ncbi:hypothetical protein [Streptomyces sp. NPDC059176]|uniref:hypothetical protein n=1 Tax=unclassified Streptomyces TaxID=2593676 RepID=UPI0036B9104D
MSASEREAPSRPQSQSRPQSAFSMSDLLASCAAASAVSTPPRERDRDVAAERDVPGGHGPHRDAA